MDPNLLQLTENMTWLTREWRPEGLSGEVEGRYGNMGHLRLQPLCHCGFPARADWGLTTDRHDKILRWVPSYRPEKVRG